MCSLTSVAPTNMCCMCAGAADAQDGPCQQRALDLWVLGFVLHMCRRSGRPGRPREQRALDLRPGLARQGGVQRGQAGAVAPGPA